MIFARVAFLAAVGMYFLSPFSLKENMHENYVDDVEISSEELKSPEYAKSVDTFVDVFLESITE